MTNNDIFQRLNTAFSFSRGDLVNIFALADFSATEEQVVAWLKQEDDGEFVEFSDSELATFLNGFINLKRGKRDGDQPKPEAHINNNMVLQKLRIALNLKSEDILDVFELENVHFSKHEVSAFFRKPNNKHYRECTDKTLSHFFQGIQSQLGLNEIDLD